MTATILEILGLGVLVTGVALVYVPAGLIVAGLAMVLVAQGLAPSRPESGG